MTLRQDRSLLMDTPQQSNLHPAKAGSYGPLVGGLLGTIVVAALVYGALVAITADAPDRASGPASMTIPAPDRPKYSFPNPHGTTNLHPADGPSAVTTPNSPSGAGRN